LITAIFWASAMQASYPRTWVRSGECGVVRTIFRKVDNTFSVKNGAVPLTVCSFRCRLTEVLLARGVDLGRAFLVADLSWVRDVCGVLGTPKNSK